MKSKPEFSQFKKGTLRELLQEILSSFKDSGIQELYNYNSMSNLFEQNESNSSHSDSDSCSSDSQDL